MKSEEIRKIVDDVYDDSREDSIRAMIGEFYNRRMLSTAVVIWIAGLLLLGGSVYSAIRFFGVVETRDQIMYAAIFIVCAYMLGLMKIFAWQMIHRNSIKREIKRVELRIAELVGSMNKTA
ncbi:MAG: hypothetical protein JW955_19975 [Sedimentisphaerales bacterium]|nr:hypothetical protein [Sedimentisphaerales bacterium]